MDGRGNANEWEEWEGAAHTGVAVVGPIYQNECLHLSIQRGRHHYISPGGHATLCSNVFKLFHIMLLGYFHMD